MAKASVGFKSAPLSVMVGAFVPCLDHDGSEQGLNKTKARKIPLNSPGVARYKVIIQPEGFLPCLDRDQEKVRLLSSFSTSWREWKAGGGPEPVEKEEGVKETTLSWNQIWDC